MPLAFYRRYRPKVFEDLLGQEAAITVLKNAARADRLGHAYLFYGPRGTGKTSAARILAKIANCLTRASDASFRAKGEPCNHCRPCEEIDAGRALDVIEIDAASNRGIDEIRELRESIKLSPTSYRSKVFIIDETHQLTKEAFNALLKTLEEPPAHAMFILATTEYDKVPATILSRTQRFRFRKMPLAELAKKLKMIAKEEKLKVAPDAIELIAAAAEGSFRDAESLLDQLTALDEEVTAEAVERTIGTVGVARTAALADHILKRDLPAALASIRELSEHGYNLVEFTKDLIHYLRKTLTLKMDPRLEEIFREDLTDRELKELKAASALIVPETHIPLLRSLIRAWSDMRYSPFQAIPLEVALIEHLASKARA